MTTPELSYCDMKKTGNFLPQFKLYEVFRTNYLGNISMECPMKPERLYFSVAEFMGDEEQYKKPLDSTVAPTNGFGVHLPNGRYRFTVRFGTKDDSNAVFVQWIREIRIQFNDENF
jgi:hypothetical protein